MKKLVLLFVFSSLITSCRITKSVEMMQAKSNATLTTEQFLKMKNVAISFLELTPEQLLQAEKIWSEEKRGFMEIDIKDNSQIAPIVYKSEVEFRKILTDKQLIDYKKIGHEVGDSRVSKYFLSDHAMSELKRIYKL